MQSLSTFLVLLAILSGCASEPSTTQSNLVGTWQLLGPDKEPVPHYVRYYKDGRFAWWPAIEPQFSVNGVTYGRYHVDGSALVIEGGEVYLDSEGHVSTNRDSQHPISFNMDSMHPVSIRGNQMIVVGDDLNDVLLRVPDREPRK